MTRKRAAAEVVDELLRRAEEEGEAEPEIAPEVRQRRPPDHTPAFLRFTPPPDSSEGEGRAYSMPHTHDRERWKRFIRGATDTRGVFGVEIRNRNQSIIGRDSIEVEAEQYAQPAQSQSAAQPGTAPLAGSLSGFVNELDSALGGMQRINEKISPQPQVTREDLETATRRAAQEAAQETVRAVAAELKAAQPSAPEKPKSFTDGLRELAEAQQLLDNLTGAKRNPDPPKSKTLAEQIEEARQMTETLAPLFGGREDEGGFSKGVRLLKETVSSVGGLVGDVAQNPMAVGLLMRLFGAQPPATPTPGAQPQQPGEAALQGQQTQAQPQQQQPQSGVVVAARHLAKACTQNNVEGGADVIESLLKSDPAAVFEMQPLLSMPSFALLEWLASTAGTPWLIDLPHGVTFFDELREELTERSQRNQSDEDEGDGAEVPAASNGHRAQSADVPTM